ncbi:MAG: MotA/TolQ/ExbB proton channel family protein [Phycisphaerae bacterium]|jgi:biopolymer transport protein ExbB|nr:MotA/TolQ/ExbB proton channel family protein [Phycisphaerae bacterium]MCZ2398760.1 MotA/TolQ/ExbB proton channel family protein [Phycisphaerae bacterium]
MRWVRLAGIAIVLGGPLPLCAAQSAGPTEPRSLWGVFVNGIEWPAYFIVAGSFAIIAIIVDHFVSVRRVNVAPAEQVSKARQLIELRKFRECLETLSRSTTYFSRVMTAALMHGRHGFDAMHEAAVEKSSELSGRMFRKVEFMNIIGNLGPLMGLLGTVWGMIIAFKDLGSGGGAANAGELARGISLALVNTLLGLVLAVVGLGFFGWCRNRVESLTVQATVEVLDLLEYFRPVPTATEVKPVLAARAQATDSGGSGGRAAAVAQPRSAGD